MNNGVLVHFLTRRRFDYSFLPASGSQVITLEPALDTLRYSYVGLYVRVHEIAMASGQSLVISMFNAVPSDCDSREFVDSANSVLNVTVTNTAPTNIPGICYDYTTRFGPYLKIVLTANQALASSGTLYAELSATLELRAQ